MLLSFLFGIIGDILLTVICLVGSSLAPQVAYWTMTSNVKKIMEEEGVSRKFSRKSKISLIILTVIVLCCYIAVIIYAGKQGVESGMDLLHLSIRFVIFWWMISIFDAVVLDWWMFSKTNMFGKWLKKITGKEPPMWRIEPQWDGYEIYKLIGEVVLSVIMAGVFLKIF